MYHYNCIVCIIIYLYIFYIMHSIYRIYFTRIGQEAILAKTRAYRGPLQSPWLALSNFDQRFSGEKPWDLSLGKNSPYFAPAAT